MASSNDDIMDFLMKTLFSFFGWIIGIIFKVTIGLLLLIIKGIISGIKALLSNKTTTENIQPTEDMLSPTNEETALLEEESGSVEELSTANEEFVSFEKAPKPAGENSIE